MDTTQARLAAGRRARLLTSLAVVLCLGLFLPMAAGAETTTIPSVWGSVLDLEIDGTFDFVVGNLVMGLGHVSNSRDQRAITEFDLSVISEHAFIHDATFEARIFGGTGGEPQIDVYGYAGDGAVTLADGYETTDFLVSFQGELGTVVSLDMTNIVHLLQRSEQFVGFHFQNVTFGTSREFDHNTGSEPTMTVEWTQLEECFADDFELGNTSAWSDTVGGS